jgi:hypothetical protein
LNKGFKPKSCDDRDCFVCNVYPPTLSTRAIRNLGATLGKINYGKLTNEALAKKKISTAPSTQQTGKPEAIGTKKAVAKKAASTTTSRIEAKAEKGKP